MSFCMLFIIHVFAVLCTGCNKNMSFSKTIPVDTLQSISSGEKKQATQPESFGFGKPVSAEEISTLDIDVRPDGTGLPPGTGLIKEGRALYLQKCMLCHGKTGREGGLGGKLISSALDSNRTKTIGNYWPYATTVYDYIYRAMPYNEPGSLTSKEVYDLTAYLLYENGIIDSTFLITEKSLPLIEMPAKQLFVPDDRNLEIKSGNR